MFGNEKRLPAAALDIKILERKVFGIEKISKLKMIEKIKTDEGRVVLERIIANLNDADYNLFLTWLNGILENKEHQVSLTDFVNELSFIRFLDNGIKEHISWNLIKEGEQKLLLNNGFKSISEILVNLGFQISLFNINDFDYIYGVLDVYESYHEKDLEFFRIIKSKQLKQNENNTSNRRYRW